MLQFYKSMQCFIIVAILVISQVISVPLEPGQPGGPWTPEEIGIVRDKVISEPMVYFPN